MVALKAARTAGRWKGGNRSVMALTDEQRTGLKNMGLDPDRIAAMSDDTNYEDWKALKNRRGPS